MQPLSTAPWIDCSAGMHHGGAPGDPKTGVLCSYVGNEAIYQCPSTDGRDIRYPDYPDQTFSYGLGQWWLYQRSEEIDFDPDRTIMLVDSGNSKSTYFCQPDDGNYKLWELGASLHYDLPTDRHVG